MIRAIFHRLEIKYTRSIKLIGFDRISIVFHHKNIERRLSTSPFRLAENKANTNPKLKKYNRPPPIDLKSVRTNQSHDENGQNSGKKKKTSKAGAYFFLTIPAITFALGVWQLYRREEKLKLIQFLNERTKSEPIDLTLEPEQLEKITNENEYKPFRLRGHFLHSREVVLTMRHDLSGHTHVPGGFVITPFVLTSSPNTIVLVNRGFVPYTHLSPTSRRETQIESEVEIVGLLRSNEPKNTFTPVNIPPNEWHYRDVYQLAQVLGTKPIFLDAVSTSGLEKDKMPYPGQTVIQLRNDHLIYIITWFSLSLITSVLWWRRFAKYL